MICDRCGRANPPSLTFCQDCGQRLLAPANLTTAASPVAAPMAPVAISAQPVGREIVGPPSRGCGRCGAPNPQAHRFCVACGSPLAEIAAARPKTGTAVLERPPLPGLDATRPSAFVTPPRPSEPKAAPLAVTAKLVVIEEDGSEGESHLLATAQIDLGREEGDIVLGSDPYLSPRHARFVRRGDAFYVQNLGSLNGIFLRLTGSAPLVHGDLLLVGLQVLKFELVNGAEQALGPAFRHGTRLFGSPVFPRYARLCQRTVEGVTRNVFYLHKDETTVGRESGDIVFSDDPYLSRRHLAVRRHPTHGGFTLEDFGSSNGTYLAIREETRLQHGAQLRVGQHLFRFDLIGRADHGEGARRIA